jgi:hypothetical protein
MITVSRAYLIKFRAKKTLENQGFKRVKKWGAFNPPLSDSF